MIVMMLSPSDLSLGGRELSSEARDVLDDYNQWVSSNYRYAHEKDVEKALDALLVLFPQNQAIILRRAQIYFEQDKFDVARADITFVLTQDPTHVDALILSVSIAHKAQQDEVLLADLECFLSLQPFLSDLDMFDEQVRMRSWRSDVYIKRKAFDLALPDLAYIIEQVEPSSEQEYLLPYYYKALNTRSKIFKAQGQLKAEIDDLNDLLSPPFSLNQEYSCYEPYGNVHSYSRRGLYRRSEIFVTQENYEGALRDLDVLLSEMSWDAPALMLRHQVYQKLNQKNQALKDELDLHDAVLLSPVYQKQGETQPLMLGNEDLNHIDFEHDEIERVIPSLQTFAKMTFFKHEINMDTSEWVASNLEGVRTLFNATGITPEAINHMRIRLSNEACTVAETTVFEALETCELAAEDWDVGVSNMDNKKRKHDALSCS
ncbi:MAG: hypothetical protein P1U36_08135 [Legionellaceae bacterium]|nr:hypothetical protein [Legionellaceae bacterium]